MAPPQRVGAPLNGKSWIRHWLLCNNILLRKKPPPCFYEFIINNQLQELKELVWNSGHELDLDAYKQFAVDGNTGLLLAAQHGHVSAAELLLAGGAEVNRCDQGWGCTPLLMAAQGGHEDMVTVLLKNGRLHNFIKKKKKTRKEEIKQ